MAADTIQALAGTMQLQLSGMEQYAGGIILPKGLYRALDKAERGEREQCCFLRPCCAMLTR